MAKSNRKSRRSKSAKARPDKPRENFPLFPHGSGMWAKKLRGKLIYFGSWRLDPTGEAAEAEFKRTWESHVRGETPPPPPDPETKDGLTLRVLCNRFLEAKDAQLKSGELSERAFRDYHQACARLIDFFHKDRRVDHLQPADFRRYRLKLAETLGPTSLKNAIIRARMVFIFGHKNGELKTPIVFGDGFDVPSQTVIRKSKNAGGEKLFEREEVHQILDALDGKSVTVEGEANPVKLKADPVMRCMVLLGLNCAFGNSDLANLPRSAVDLEKGVVNFARVKTGIQRRIPLWPETVAALKIALAKRPAPVDASDARLCFLTRNGRPWVRLHKREAENDDSLATAVPIDALAPEFAKILKKLRINGRKGLGFYTCRHTFETMGGECKDQVAVDAIMGHVDHSMAGNYRHKISDERLRDCVNTVRTWLFAEGGAE